MHPGKVTDLVKSQDLSKFLSRADFCVPFSPGTESPPPSGNPSSPSLFPYSSLVPQWYPAATLSGVRQVSFDIPLRKRTPSGSKQNSGTQGALLLSSLQISFGFSVEADAGTRGVNKPTTTSIINPSTKILLLDFNFNLFLSSLIIFFLLPFNQKFSTGQVYKVKFFLSYGFLKTRQTSFIV